MSDEQGFMKEWRHRRFHETPSERRVRMQKEGERRRDQLALNESLRYIMWKKNRYTTCGFVCSLCACTPCCVPCCVVWLNVSAGWVVV